jgi:YVTN family beta-propeller protein
MGTVWTKRMLVVGLSGTLLCAGCSNAPGKAGTTANGSIAVTKDDALLYAADSDLDTVFAVDTASNKVVSRIRVGAGPEKVLIGDDDTVYVTNRNGRSVSVIRRGESTEFSRIDVAVEPSSLGLSGDGKTLFVVNAASRTNPEVGTLMAIDTKTRSVRWEIEVGADPRGLSVLEGDKAMVSLHREGSVVLIDTAKAAVLSAGDDAFSKLNASALGIAQRPGTRPPSPTSPPSSGSSSSQTGPRTLRFRGGGALLPSTDGRQVYMAARLSTDATLSTRSTTTGTGGGPGGSSGYSGKTCAGSRGASAAAIVTFNASAQAQVEDVKTCESDDDADGRPVMLPVSKSVLQGPAALALDSTGSFLFVANEESNNVMVLSTVVIPSKSGGFEGGRETGFPGSEGSAADNTRAVISVGAAPTGIVVSADGKRAWTYNLFDHSISVIARSGNDLINAGTFKVADDTLPADVVAGRKLFFSAVDTRMNNPSTMGMACASCHPAGREDGHVWNFPDGPRQTPSLAGKHTLETAPFHWNGEFDSLLSFMTHTVKDRMGGSGVTEEMEKQMAAYIRSIPAPDNASGATVSADTLRRGEAVFRKAACNSCHSGVALTDNQFYNVGTLVRSGMVVDNDKFLPKGLNTPSLLGIARSAPYLHDGSASTIKLRILQGKELNQHGLTAALSDEEVDDLAAYVKSL